MPDSKNRQHGYALLTAISLLLAVGILSMGTVSVLQQFVASEVSSLEHNQERSVVDSVNLFEDAPGHEVKPESKTDIREAIRATAKD